MTIPGELAGEERRRLLRAWERWQRVHATKQEARTMLLERFEELLRAGYSQAAIARAVGVTRAEVNRLLRFGDRIKEKN